MSATVTLRAPGAPFAAARQVRVHSADELRRALRETRDRPLALDASALDCLLRADESRRAIEVQGAMRWSRLAADLGPCGEPLARWLQCAALPATVAQAVSADAAGPDGAPLTACVDAIALVTLDGELRRLDRERHADMFRLVVGGQGVFGLIYSVTLRVDALLQAAEHALPPLEILAPGPASTDAIASEVETLLPPDQVESFQKAAHALAFERRVTLRRIAVCQLRQGAETALGWATRNWAGVSVRLETRATLGACVQTAEICRALHAEAIARGGSFPARAARRVSRAQLDACYPQLPAFLAEKRRYDPAERLQNAWYRSVTALMRHPVCDSRWTN